MTTTSVAAPPARPLDSTRPRPPNLLAQQITGRQYLSHSQIALMRACPRKFAFQYVENAPKDFVPSSLIFGGSIHRALELYFRCRLEGLAVTPQALLSAYHDRWKQQRQEAGGDAVPVRFNKGEDANSVHACADRIITAFLGSPLASPKGTILGIEEELKVVLDLQIPDLLAKVDLVTHTDGALHVIDWKTSRSRWNEQKAQENGEQLVLYGATVGAMSVSLNLPVKLHFAIVTKAKKPQVQLIPVPGDSGRLEQLKENIGQVWQAIQSGNFYPSPSPQHCTTCPFRSRCPVFAQP